jgi:hypothetical protein
MDGGEGAWGLASASLVAARPQARRPLEPRTRMPMARSRPSILTL